MGEVVEEVSFSLTQGRDGSLEPCKETKTINANSFRLGKTPGFQAELRRKWT